MAAEGGEPRLILALHAPEGERVRIGDLSWSPGESTIRFTRDQKMWEVSSSGSNPHQLLLGWHASASQWGGQWTLDGEFFLFVSGSIGSMNRFPSYNHGGQLWAFDERRGWLRPPIADPIQLTSGPMVWGPAVSARDGRRIFSRGMSVRGDLVRYDKRSNHFDPYLRGISAEMVAFFKGRNLCGLCHVSRRHSVASQPGWHWTPATDQAALLPQRCTLVAGWFGDRVYRQFAERCGRNLRRPFAGWHSRAPHSRGEWAARRSHLISRR
jgi:hypothetical protein